jgi:hypothetical protein
MRQILARDAQEIRRPEVSGRDDDMARPLLVWHSAARLDRETEIAARPRDTAHACVLPDGKIEVRDDRAIVRQRVAARRLGDGDDERESA